MIVFPRAQIKSRAHPNGVRNPYITIPFGGMGRCGPSSFPKDVLHCIGEGLWHRKWRHGQNAVRDVETSRALHVLGVRNQPPGIII